MASDPKTSKFKVCPNCGRQYLNWCTKCRETAEVEEIPEILSRYGLTADNLVLSLAGLVAQDFWPAVQFAFQLRGLGHTKKTEVSGPGGGPIPVSVGVEFVKSEGEEDESENGE